MNRQAILTIGAGLIGAAAIGFGAFGAHAIDGLLSEKASVWWTTATLYALTHALAILALSPIAPKHRELFWAGILWVLGAFFFSGSLWAMALLSLSAAPFGPLIFATPIGGLCLLAGWLLVIISGISQQQQK